MRQAGFHFTDSECSSLAYYMEGKCSNGNLAKNIRCQPSTLNQIGNCVATTYNQSSDSAIVTEVACNLFYRSICQHVKRPKLKHLLHNAAQPQIAQGRRLTVRVTLIADKFLENSKIFRRGRSAMRL